MSDSLAHRVANLEQALERKSRALEDAKDEFQAMVYAISHDFRAPLRAILSTGMILREDYGDQLGDEGLTELERQGANVRKLNVLIEELLTVSRLANHEVRRERVDLRQIAVEAAKIVGPAATDALQIQPGRTLEGDPELLRIALEQLFSNSVKFASTEKPLSIEVWIEDDRVLIRDNGIGFAQDKARRVFLPFERLHGETYPGSGIGLTVFKRIMDFHDGAVGCQSCPGEGSTFWFTLEG